MDNDEKRELAWKMKIIIERKVTLTPMFKLNTDLNYTLVADKTGINEAVNEIIELLETNGVLSNGRTKTEG